MVVSSKTVKLKRYGEEGIVPGMADWSGAEYTGNQNEYNVPMEDWTYADTVPMPVPASILEQTRRSTTASTFAARTLNEQGHESELPSASGHGSGSAVVRGTLSLIVREGLLRVVVLIANILLARVLAPKVFGVFVILGFFNTFLTTFGQFGLGPALVQRPEEPTTQEMAALFTFQVAVAAILTAVAALIAPELSMIYHLGAEGIWLIRVMALGFMLISAASIPMALLERRLAFGRIAVIEVLSGILYQTVAVTLAMLGWGVWSLVIGTLASSVAWLIATYIAKRWMPRFSFRWHLILPMIRFGLHYQVNNFISLFKDNIVSTFVAALLGAAAVGYINWGTTLAFYPLIVVQLVARVTFPAFARAIHDRSRLQRMVEATIRYQCYIAFPAVAALAAFIPQITHIIFTDKWQPGVQLVYFFLLPTVVSAATMPLIAGLNALGRPDVVWRLMLMWFVLDWVLSVSFVLWLGYLGFAVANALVALSSVVTVLLFKRYQPIAMLQNVLRPALAMLMTIGVFLFLGHVFAPSTLVMLMVYGLAVFGVFALLEVLIDYHFVPDVRYVFRAIFSRTRRTQMAIVETTHPS